MGILSAFGLMRVSEHEAAIRPFRERLFDSEQQRIRWQGEANDANTRFRRAATDLAGLSDQLDELRPDAEKWRDRADREQKRGQAKRKAPAGHHTTPVEY